MLPRANQPFMRENHARVSNILIHREYMNAFPAKLIKELIICAY